MREENWSRLDLKILVKSAQAMENIYGQQTLDPSLFRNRYFVLQTFLENMGEL